MVYNPQVSAFFFENGQNTRLLQIKFFFNFFLENSEKVTFSLEFGLCLFAKNKFFYFEKKYKSFSYETFLVHFCNFFCFFLHTFGAFFLVFMLTLTTLQSI